MGAWGTSLYANDLASDIRADYIDRLKRGDTNEEVTTFLLNEYAGACNDPDEEPLFWYALADIQWKYGRLESFVKEKALFFLQSGHEDQRWLEAGVKKQAAWRATLDDLMTRLSSPIPPEKKVSRYKFHHCPWQLGDVFAYRFSGEDSMCKGFFGKYLYFRKITEEMEWPGHTIPVIQFYFLVTDEILRLTDIQKTPLLITNMVPATLHFQPDYKKKYVVALSTSNPKLFPQENLTYLGNLPGDDVMPYRSSGYYGDCQLYEYVGWEKSRYNNKIESFFIDQYTLWRGYERSE